MVDGDTQNEVFLIDDNAAGSSQLWGVDHPFLTLFSRFLLLAVCKISDKIRGLETLGTRLLFPRLRAGSGYELTRCPHKGV